jgi:nucleoside-diphosphate-sugar epimerase
MLELAQECRNIITFTHVSTAYVNSNKVTKVPGQQNLIEEKVYELPNNQDPEEVIADILR